MAWTKSIRDWAKGLNTVQRICLALLAICVPGVAALTLLPIGWQLNRFVVWAYYTMLHLGAPRFMTIDTYDYLLNMLLFAVPVALAGVVWPRVPWWAWIVGGACISTCIELTQWVFLPRDASWVDVTSNSTGAVFGVVVARVAVLSQAR